MHIILQLTTLCGNIFCEHHIIKIKNVQQIFERITIIISIYARFADYFILYIDSGSCNTYRSFNLRFPIWFHYNFYIHPEGIRIIHHMCKVPRFTITLSKKFAFRGKFNNPFPYCISHCYNVINFARWFSVLCKLPL